MCVCVCVCVCVFVCVGVCVIQCRNCGKILRNPSLAQRVCVGGEIYPDKIFVGSQDKGNQGQWTTQELNRLSTN